MATTFEITVKNSPASAETPSWNPDHNTNKGTGQVSWDAYQIMTIGEAVSPMLEIDYDYELFNKLTVNGKELTRDVEYFVEEGSTILTLSESYASSLPAGEHHLAIYYTDGSVVKTSLVVAKSKQKEQEIIDSGTITPNTGTFQKLPDYGSIFSFGGQVILAIAFSTLVLFILQRVFRKLIKQLKHTSQQSLRFRAPAIPISFKIRKKIFFPLSVATLTLFALIFAFNSLGVFTKIKNPDAANAAGSLSLSVSNENIKKTVDLAAGPAFFSEAQTITIDSNTANGYKLYLSSQNLDAYADLVQTDADLKSRRIASTSGTFTNPSSLSEDEFGLAIEENSFDTSFTPNLNTKFAGLPTGSQSYLLSQSNSATSAGETLTTHFGFSLSQELPDGTYAFSHDDVNNVAALVYTAISNPDPSHFVSYNCNGGEGSGTEYKNPGVDLELSDGSICSLDGQEITSWNTQPDGSGTAYSLEGTYSEESDLTLYAIYEYSLRTFTLAYDANGGEGATAEETQTLRASKYTFTISDTAPTRENYTFSGWATDKSAKAAQYQLGSDITVANSKTTLHAVWQTSSSDDPFGPDPEEPINLYQIVYECAAGTGGSVVFKAEGQSIELNDGSTCQRENWEISHWNTKADDTGTSYALGSSYDIDAELTLYAIYAKASRTFTLKYNANGGTNAPQQETKTVSASSYSFTIPTSIPTRDGYGFLGWSTNKNSLGKVYSPGEKITVTNSTTTLYALWQAVLPAKVEQIQLSADKTTLLANSPDKTATLQAEVFPADAENKSLTYKSSDTSIATVTQAGKITAVGPGVATITATAQDGSGAKSTLKITVKQKKIIVIGPSYLTKIAGEGGDRAHVTEYTDDSSGNYYSVADKTLYFVYKNGSQFEWQTLGGEGWQAIDSFVKSFNSKKDYIAFYIFFMTTSNSTRRYTCDELRGIDSALVNQWAKDYDTSVKSLTSAGYSAVGIVISSPVLRPDQKLPETVILVSNTDSRRCKTNFRSNYKFHVVNSAFKTVIENKYPDLHFRYLFKDIVDTTDSSKDYPFKPGWEDYSTSDGLHFSTQTSIKYFRAMLNKYGGL